MSKPPGEKRELRQYGRPLVIGMAPDKQEEFAHTCNGLGITDAPQFHDFNEKPDEGNYGIVYICSGGEPILTLEVKDLCKLAPRARFIAWHVTDSEWVKIKSECVANGVTDVYRISPVTKLKYW